MKLGACVVLYNPGNDVPDNIRTYLPFVERLVAVDNSTIDCAAAQVIASMEKVEFVGMGGNMGIAAALNAGCGRLMDEGFEVVLTMDQDSQFPLHEAEEILPAVDRLLNDYAIVGLNFNARSHDAGEITVPRYWLTSGNFLSLSAYKAVGGFNDELFIDYVDIEFDCRLNRAGLKICYLNKYSLIHKIGNPIPIRFFGKTFYAMNESPIRCYYRYRNSSYLYRSDKPFYRCKYFTEIFVNIPKILLFEPEKAKKMKMIHRGLRDGANGILGPLKDGLDNE